MKSYTKRLCNDCHYQLPRGKCAYKHIWGVGNGMQLDHNDENICAGQWSKKPGYTTPSVSMLEKLRQLKKDK